MEVRHPWHRNIKIKGSDRLSSVLILDSILVYATLIMWVSLSAYPNLHKEEKIKSTVKILQEHCYSIYLTHQLCHK